MTPEPVRADDKVVAQMGGPVPVADVMWLGALPVEDDGDQLPGPLAAAADRVAAIREAWVAGTVDPDAACAALAECVVTGPDGRRWSVGVDTGRWYVDAGDGWVVADPPRA